MPTLTTALKDLLASCAGLTAIIGSNPMRYYPVRLPQPPIIYPAITYQRVDSVGVYAHSGYSGLQNARIQLTIWAQTYAQGDAIETVLRAQPPTGINGFRGTQSGLQIDRIFLTDGLTDFDTDTSIHQRTIDLLIGYVS